MPGFAGQPGGQHALPSPLELFLAVLRRLKGMLDDAARGTADRTTDGGASAIPQAARPALQALLHATCGGAGAKGSAALGDSVAAAIALLGRVGARLGASAGGARVPGMRAP
eukprot:2604650-Prymnesium_polylepis.1